MKKIIAFILVLVFCLSMTSALADLRDYNIVTSSQTHKVILDTDMGYFGDDTYALMILLQADAAGWIDLLGVTSAANRTTAEATCALLNLLEYFHRGDIPVYMGQQVPLMGFKTASEIAATGLIYSSPMERVMKYGNEISWNNLGELVNKTWGYPKELEPQEKPAYQFMIDMVNEYPGEVTIIEIGACTNVALACIIDSEFAEKTAGIYYMGGAVDVRGNTTPWAEMNWYFDAEAADICLRADFPVQVDVPHDISFTQLLDYDKVEAMMSSGETLYNKAIEEFVFPKFYADPGCQSKLWDAMVAGIYLCPELITKTEVRDLSVSTNNDATYGGVMTWAQGTGPDTSSSVQVVFDVDGEAYWSFVAELLGTEF